MNYFLGFKHEVVFSSDVRIHVWKAGEAGEAVLLLHGHPESHYTWFRVAPLLQDGFTVIVPDLRGYGESDKPYGEKDHSTYSKRTMAADMAAVMKYYGIQRYHVAGHDRGARVAYRMALDYPECIKSLTLIDIVPTRDVYEMTNKDIANKFWHWYFYIQPEPFPEEILGSCPEYFIRSNIQKKTIPGSATKSMFPEDIVEEYIRYYSDPATIHAISEDYRAAFSIDLVHDNESSSQLLKVPLQLLWGSDGNIGKLFDVKAVWQKRAATVEGCAIEGCGHFVPEEKPEITAQKIREFAKRHM